MSLQPFASLPLMSFFRVPAFTAPLSPHLFLLSASFLLLDLSFPQCLPASSIPSQTTCFLTCLLGSWFSFPFASFPSTSQRRFGKYPPFAFLQGSEVSHTEDTLTTFSYSQESKEEQEKEGVGTEKTGKGGGEGERGKRRKQLLVDLVLTSTKSYLTTKSL